MNKRIIIAITGASGAIYGVRILQILRDIADIETHLIISPAAKITIMHETDIPIKNVLEMADFSHKHMDIGACIASGSSRNTGMIIAPCSAKTMGEIACGIGQNLISRAADVALKERRKLALMIRETPLHSIHLENAKRLADMGAFIYPPVPAFYTMPKTIDDIVTQTALRVLDLFDINTHNMTRWTGLK